MYRSKNIVNKFVAKLIKTLTGDTLTYFGLDDRDASLKTLQPVVIGISILKKSDELDNYIIQKML